ncbi:folylpolyglutamate synthase, mitochondrial [Malaya genurostris]|uniref:folylpolyglutamate synthase, mitochondrial n=1 Tax=Malaya genurostris TaxID=325434 RepID=UPI0026F3EA3D|nr:folylpolyglutamate synthase, mitochondrial [Malaya genurostris]XP_058462951.1 folylpolyglutamate synthase, mitochondrial [Malaya genurostris]
MFLRVHQLALIASVLRRSNKMVLETSARVAANSGVASLAVKPSPKVTEKSLEQELSLPVGPVVENYENAVKALNSLQSNYSVLQNSSSRIHSSDSVHIQETIKFLERINISLQKLQHLPAIHISGTKGKGSTCSLVESILRAHGYRTGFFSSPHLVSVTERIRLNGVPIGTEKFACYFWKVYNQLLNRRSHSRDLPAYFNCLTLVAFEVFLRENVDVAIIEVGIGGKYDCTNVLRETKTVGITSLGLEHTALLGNTLEDIAWQKAGIVKEGSDVFTVSQPGGCLSIIETECYNKRANLHIVPDYDSYKWHRRPYLNTNSMATKMNTSLAIQIALSWIKNTRPELVSRNQIILSDKFSQGIESNFWPGRCHKIRKHNKRIFLDGAHTIESIEVCAKWFQGGQRKDNPKLLIFNATGDRDVFKLLSHLTKYVHFDAVFFCPNVASQQPMNIDSINLNFPKDQQIHRCEANLLYWNNLMSQRGTPSRVACVESSVHSVLEQIDNNFSKSQECDILVTGSLHLIGAVLTALKMESLVLSPS